MKLLLQKRRRRIWHSIIFLNIFLLPEILGAKFYTGNVSSPSSMKEIFIDDWPDTRKAPMSKNVTDLDKLKKALPMMMVDNSTDKKDKNETVNSLENIDFSLLCAEGVPLLQEGDQPKKCDPTAGKSDCPAGFWCHVGSSPTTFFCCPSNRKIPNLCHLPPNSGFGKEKITRYWYDWRSGYCREMVYSGYGGNENNFILRDVCEKKCSGTPKPNSLLHGPERKPPVKEAELLKTIKLPKVFTSTPRAATTTSNAKIAATTSGVFRRYPATTTTTVASTSAKPKVTNPCNLSPDKGEKTSASDSPLFRWYFDMVAERCIQFYFLGLKGNANNFEHEDSCQETCGGGSASETSCTFPMEAGFGDFLIPRYYYNAASKSCRKFTYKGYGGNHNRFTSRSTCNDICVKKTANSHSHARKSLHLTTIPTTTTTTVAPLTTTPHKLTTTTTTPVKIPLISSHKPLSLNPEIIQSIFDLNKYTSGPDPFELPKNLKPAKPIDPLTTVPEDEETTDPFEMPESQEISELTSDPFEPKTKFPMTKFPIIDNNVTEYIDSEEDDIDPFEPIVQIISNPMITTTPGNVNYPTLVSILDNTTPFPQMFTSESSSPFEQHFRKYSTETPPNSINLKSLFGAQSNQTTVPQQPQGYSITPCVIHSPTNSYLQSCRPEGTFPARNGGVWSQPCPSGTFCQVGDTIQKSICCPAFGVDPCIQSKASGAGTFSLRRWFFDAKIRQCKGFIFKGYQGNQNNFLTYEACRRQCHARNPCDYGTPFGFETSEGSQRCSPTSASCPPHFYCHIGDSTLDTVCCPLFNGTTIINNNNVTDLESHGSPLVGNIQFGARKVSSLSPCSMTISPGNGGMNLNRWAYSSAKKGCVTFVYRGSAGNSNNFLTKSDCINTCVATINPCSSGSPLIEGSNMFRCTSITGCPSGYYCHSGSSQQTSVCCPSTSISPCLLSLATGAGSAVLHRYYFDSITSSCKAFTYTGMGGNENNFLTVQECRKTCPEYDNPCVVGKPYTNPSDGSVAFCTATNPTCPKGFFCHIGDSRPTTVCCPNVGHPCSSTLVLGSGTNQLPRYYYNSKTRTCVPFVYSGKGGNANNFISKTECEIACPVLDNPCIAGFPALDAYGEPQFCSTANPSICPTGYWCHIGSTQSTTLCCPGAGDPCRLPMSKGTGTAVLNRWYFNSESKVCVSFVYSGRGGNSNNFISRQECLASCPEYSSPCPEGQPHIGLSGQITHCGATDPSICPTTYWCHVGATLETSVCCPGAADPCDQDQAKGSGSSQLLRYYYNQLSRTCNQFRYSGAGGNENNFLTKASCEARCPVFISPCTSGAPEMDESLTPVACSAADNSTCSSGYWCHVGASEQTTICCSGASTAICEEPRVIGSGDASLPRYYYNPLTKQCLPFIYLGAGGNQNNFLSKAACEGACPVLQNPCAAGEPATGSNGLYVTCSSNSPNVCPAGYWCHIGADVTEAICCPGAENPCSMPSGAGDGSASLTRWYFDANLRRCAKFTYSGSGGNQNNFLTLQECQLKCPEFESPCSTGDPAQAPSGGILFCSSTEQTCPSSYWCHIGASPESTVCCPNAGDPCLSPMQPGSGSAKLPRWYFNQNTRQCLQFTYSGSGGNGNNFLRELDCASRCPVFRNPCPNAMISNQLSVVRCSAQNFQNCPSGFWCHIGATPDSSVCCPGASDPCRLSMSQGAANSAGPYTRWYYDFTSRSCRQFQYTGFGGNENNFLTKEDCAQRCPEFVNPCFTGEPLLQPLTGMVRFCNSPRSIGCPSNYYCHLGANADTTVCCPNTRNPCTQALAEGTGSSSIPRWYFNSQSRQCQEFIYSGLQGNANNFISRAACAQACPEFSNPCGDGQPLTSIGGQVTYCSPQNRFICPRGYYCHVGAAADSTVCCPGPVNPCLLSMEVGQGSSSLPRFYFNHFTKQCQQFIYSGSGGNANNFVSLEACRQTCPEFNNPCAGGGMPFQPNGRAIFHCDASTPCPHSYYCHFGLDSISTVCCPVIDNQPPCQLPVLVGTGQASVTRYYFNSQIGQCVPFIYSGLGGNQNNYVSMNDCLNSCQISMPFLTSSIPCNGGNCQNNNHIGGGVSSQPIIIRSPFGTKFHKLGIPQEAIAEKSIPWQRRVCPQGDPLRTPTGEAVTCNVHDPQPCPDSNFVCNLNQAGDAFCCPDPKNFCLKPPNPGNCEYSPMTKYGYNPFTDTCQQFTFTGCGGNLNNFNSMAECSNICCNKGYNLLMKFNDDSNPVLEDDNVVNEENVNQEPHLPRRQKDPYPLPKNFPSSSSSELPNSHDSLEAFMDEVYDSSSKKLSSKR